MNSSRQTWKRVTADCKLTLSFSLPIFAAAIWFGISRDYDDIGLFAVAMALAALSIGDAAAVLARRLRELRAKNRGN